MAECANSNLNLGYIKLRNTALVAILENGGR